jgi:peroxiredoxin
MMPLGTQAPDFHLFDCVSGDYKSLKDVKAEQATVVMFICNHCPYVQHIQNEIAKVAAQYQLKGVSFVAISPNDPEHYPDDAPEKLKEQAQTAGFNFPYLFDETQEVAKAYQAACTPDFYVFDKNLACIYRGRFDAAKPKNDQPVNGDDLRAALDAYLHGQPVSDNQYPSIGCSIKWRS